MDSLAEPRHEQALSYKISEHITKTDTYLRAMNAESFLQEQSQRYRRDGDNPGLTEDERRFFDTDLPLGIIRSEQYDTVATYYMCKITEDGQVFLNHTEFMFAAIRTGKLLDYSYVETYPGLVTAAVQIAYQQDELRWHPQLGPERTAKD